jgi:hypothetical protein
MIIKGLHAKPLPSSKHPLDFQAKPSSKTFKDSSIANLENNNSGSLLALILLTRCLYTLPGSAQLAVMMLLPSSNFWLPVAKKKSKPLVAVTRNSYKGQ